MSNDIKDRSDIELLINSFYDKVKVDPIIGYIFTEVAKVNWETHLKVMYNFWENAIFFTGEYSGNPMKTHARVNSLTPLLPEHFQQWNSLFVKTVDELFQGANAALAKQRALSISSIMQFKILQPNNRGQSR